MPPPITYASPNQGFELCSALGVAVHEFAAIIELPYLGPDFPSPHPGVKMIRAWEVRDPVRCRPSNARSGHWTRHCSTRIAQQEQISLTHSHTSTHTLSLTRAPAVDRVASSRTFRSSR